MLLLLLLLELLLSTTQTLWWQRFFSSAERLQNFRSFRASLTFELFKTIIGSGAKLVPAIDADKASELYFKHKDEISAADFCCQQASDWCTLWENIISAMADSTSDCDALDKFLRKNAVAKAGSTGGADGALPKSPKRRRTCKEEAASPIGGPGGALQDDLTAQLTE